MSQMPPQPAKLVIESDPQNLQVNINSKVVGTTTATLVVPPGNYTVLVGEKDGKTYCQKTLSVSSGQTVVLKCAATGWVQAN